MPQPSPDDLDARLDAGRARRRRRSNLGGWVRLLSSLGLVASVAFIESSSALALAVTGVSLGHVGSDAIVHWGDEAQLRQLTRAVAFAFVVLVLALGVTNAIEWSTGEPQSSALALLAGAIGLMIGDLFTALPSGDAIDWDDPSTWGPKDDS